MDRLLLWLYASQAVGWTVALPLVMVSALGNSVRFVNAISIWALVLGGASGWAGMLAARRANGPS